MTDRGPTLSEWDHLVAVTLWLRAHLDAAEADVAMMAWESTLDPPRDKPRECLNCGGDGWLQWQGCERERCSCCNGLGSPDL